MTRTIYVLPVDAEPHLAQSDCSLASLQALVGGYLEIVPLVPGAPGDSAVEQLLDGAPKGARVVLLVNETGRLEGLARNVAATAMAGQLIVGTAVICALD